MQACWGLLQRAVSWLPLESVLFLIAARISVVSGLGPVTRTSSTCKDQGAPVQAPPAGSRLRLQMGGFALLAAAEAQAEGQ